MAELADALGCSKRELTNYLAKFIPDSRQAAECLTEDVVTVVATRMTQTAVRRHTAVVADANAPSTPHANVGISTRNLDTSAPDLANAWARGLDR
jgi:hypothetical protein